MEAGKEVVKDILEAMTDEIEAIVEAFETHCHECHSSPKSCPLAKIAEKYDPKYFYDGYFCHFNIRSVASKIIENAIQLTLEEIGR